MKEAQEQLARFPELEASDFDRICEFAYRGTYSDPEPVAYADDDTEIQKDFSILSGSISEADGMLDPMAFVDAFTNTYPKTFGSEATHVEVESVRRMCDRENNSTERSDPEKLDVGPVLLGHARLYVFAGRYMIERLQRLAALKLYTYLDNLQLQAPALARVMELVKYVYSNENTQDHGEDTDIDPLREVVLSFAICHRKTFMASKKHLNELGQQNEYAIDFTLKLQHILSASEAKREEFERTVTGKVKKKKKKAYDASFGFGDSS